MSEESVNKPLEIVRNMKGVVNAFYLDKAILGQMKEEEEKVKAMGNIAVNNEGFSEALVRDHVIAIIKDPRFRPPPEPTVVLMSDGGEVMGLEVFPFTAKEYLNRDGVIWLSDAFVLFPEIKGTGHEKFVMPPVSFPELNKGNGCKDVVSCSPAPTCDLLMRTYYKLKDDPKLASVLVGYNDI
ncbi:MAG: hypothetical protein LBG63_02570 [Candidatus Methanoplasma sp.]|jgi:hypothetical protein|nr:hypothetical protein [Candidatus Methanoplasma sp.]